MQKPDHLALLVADVFEAAGALRLHGDQIAAAVGQSQARWQVLSVLSEGDWTVATAARRLGVTRQSVLRITDLLARDGLARYEPNPRHKGSPLVRLTDTGRSALAVITSASRAWRQAASADIPDEHLAITRVVLRALVKRTRDGGQGPPPSSGPGAADRSSPERRGGGGERHGSRAKGGPHGSDTLLRSERL